MTNEVVAVVVVLPPLGQVLDPLLLLVSHYSVFPSLLVVLSALLLPVVAVVVEVERVVLDRRPRQHERVRGPPCD